MAVYHKQNEAREADVALPVGSLGNSPTDVSNPQVLTISVLDAEGGRIQLPDPAFLVDARMERSGSDLILTLLDGRSIVVEGYFSAEQSPDLVAAQSVLSPFLVNAFLEPPAGLVLASGDELGDAIGVINSIEGLVYATHANAERIVLQEGSQIYQGDVVETMADGSIKITLLDDSVFSLGRSARFAIEELMYDYSGESGSLALSLLKGGFTFISGLIAKDDPESIQLNTPVATIGIRGTVIAGKVDPTAADGGTIYSLTLIDGAIQLEDVFGNPPAFFFQPLETLEVRRQGSGTSEPIFYITSVENIVGSTDGAFGVLSSGDFARIETDVHLSAEDRGVAPLLYVSDFVNAVSGGSEASDNVSSFDLLPEPGFAVRVIEDNNVEQALTFLNSEEFLHPEAGGLTYEQLLLLFSQEVAEELFGTQIRTIVRNDFITVDDGVETVVDQLEVEDSAFILVGSSLHADEDYSIGLAGGGGKNILIAGGLKGAVPPTTNSPVDYVEVIFGIPDGEAGGSPWSVTLGTGVYAFSDLVLTAPGQVRIIAGESSYASDYFRVSVEQGVSLLIDPSVQNMGRFEELRLIAGGALLGDPTATGGLERSFLGIGTLRVEGSGQIEPSYLSLEIAELLVQSQSTLEVILGGVEFDNFQVAGFHASHGGVVRFFMDRDSFLDFSGFEDNGSIVWDIADLGELGDQIWFESEGIGFTDIFVDSVANGYVGTPAADGRHYYFGDGNDLVTLGGNLAAYGDAVLHGGSGTDALVLEDAVVPTVDGPGDGDDRIVHAVSFEDVWLAGTTTWALNVKSLGWLAAGGVTVNIFEQASFSGNISISSEVVLTGARALRGDGDILSYYASLAGGGGIWLDWNFVGKLLGNNAFTDPNAPPQAYDRVSVLALQLSGDANRLVLDSVTTDPNNGMITPVTSAEVNLLYGMQNASLEVEGGTEDVRVRLHDGDYSTAGLLLASNHASGSIFVIDFEEGSNIFRDVGGAQVSDFSIAIGDAASLNVGSSLAGIGVINSLTVLSGGRLFSNETLTLAIDEFSTYTSGRIELGSLSLDIANLVVVPGEVIEVYFSGSDTSGLQVAAVTNGAAAELHAYFLTAADFLNLAGGIGSGAVGWAITGLSLNGAQAEISLESRDASGLTVDGPGATSVVNAGDGKTHYMGGGNDEVTLIGGAADYTTTFFHGGAGVDKLYLVGNLLAGNNMALNATSFEDIVLEGALSGELKDDHFSHLLRLQGELLISEGSSYTGDVVAGSSLTVQAGSRKNVGGHVYQEYVTAGRDQVWIDHGIVGMTAAASDFSGGTVVQSTWEKVTVLGNTFSGGSSTLNFALASNQDATILVEGGLSGTSSNPVRFSATGSSVGDITFKLGAGTYQHVFLGLGADAVFSFETENSTSISNGTTIGNGFGLSLTNKDASWDWNSLALLGTLGTLELSAVSVEIDAATAQTLSVGNLIVTESATIDLSNIALQVTSLLVASGNVLTLQFSGTDVSPFSLTGGLHANHAGSVVVEFSVPSVEFDSSWETIFDSVVADRLEVNSDVILNLDQLGIDVNQLDVAAGKTLTVQFANGAANIADFNVNTITGAGKVRAELTGSVDVASHSSVGFDTIALSGTAAVLRSGTATTLALERLEINADASLVLDDLTIDVDALNVAAGQKLVVEFDSADTTSFGVDASTGSGTVVVDFSNSADFANLIGGIGSGTAQWKVSIQPNGGSYEIVVEEDAANVWADTAGYSSQLGDTNTQFSAATAETYYYGDGDDEVELSGNNSLYGSAFFHGGAGNDVLTLSNFTLPSTGTLNAVGFETINIVGTLNGGLTAEFLTNFSEWGQGDLYIRDGDTTAGGLTIAASGGLVIDSSVATRVVGGKTYQAYTDGTDTVFVDISLV